jgi:hypothetical protein
MGSLILPSTTLAPSPRGARVLGRADAVVEPNRRVGRAPIDRGEAHRAGHGDRSVGLTIQRIVRPTVRAVAVSPR